MFPAFTMDRTTAGVRYLHLLPQIKHSLTMLLPLEMINSLAHKDSILLQTDLIVTIRTTQKRAKESLGARIGRSTLLA